MNIEEVLDIFDIDEIEKLSPEECKGLLKGFFIGAGFMMAIDDGISKDIENRFYKPYRRQDRQEFRKIRLAFQTREDASEVLDDLREKLEMDEDHYVSVRTLYYFADLPTNTVMMNWGWYDLEDCEITREADHYILKMPPAEYIHICNKNRVSDIS